MSEVIIVALITGFCSVIGQWLISREREARMDAAQYAYEYLEEEDELENQYRTYMSKVEENLIRVKHTYYSSYDTCHEEPDEHQDSNPYWIGDDE